MLKPQLLLAATLVYCFGTIADAQNVTETASPSIAPVLTPTDAVPPPSEAQTVAPTVSPVDTVVPTSLPPVAVQVPTIPPPVPTNAAVTEPPTDAGATPTDQVVPTPGASTVPPTNPVLAPTDAAQPAPTDAATEPPTAAAGGGATEPPTAAPPPTAPLPCFTSLTTLDEVEREVTDLDVVRNYVLCADTTFFTGFLTTNGDILGGDKPLTLRKNMHIWCGEVGGGSENNCIISRGSFGLTSIPNNFEPPTVNNNVIVQGVTFENAALYGVLIGLAGGFQFIDCIFDVSFLLTPCIRKLLYFVCRLPRVFLVSLV